MDEILTDNLIEQLLRRVGPSALAINRRFRHMLTDDIEYHWLVTGWSLAPINVDHLPQLSAMGYQLRPEVWFDLFMRSTTRSMAWKMVKLSMVNLTARQLVAAGYLDYLLGDEFMQKLFERSQIEPRDLQRYLPVLATDRERVLAASAIDSSTLDSWLELLWQGAPLVRGVRLPLTTTLDLARRPSQLNIPGFYGYVAAIMAVIRWGPVPVNWRKYLQQLDSERAPSYGNALLDNIVRQARLLALTEHQHLNDAIADISGVYQIRDQVNVILSNVNQLETIPTTLAHWLLRWHTTIDPHKQQRLLWPLVIHYDRKVGELATVMIQRNEYFLSHGAAESLALIPSRSLLTPTTLPAIDRLYRLAGPHINWEFLINWSMLIAMAVKQTRWYTYRHQVDLWFRNFQPPIELLDDGRIEVGLVNDWLPTTDKVEYRTELGFVMALSRLIELGLFPPIYLNNVVGLPTSIVHQIEALVGERVQINVHDRVIITQLPTGPVRSVILHEFVIPKCQIDHLL